MTNGRIDKQKPKAIWPLNFFELGGKKLDNMACNLIVLSDVVLLFKVQPFRVIE